MKDTITPDDSEVDDDRRPVPYIRPSVLFDEETCKSIDWKAVYGF